jgi:hypothetical protein
MVGVNVTDSTTPKDTVAKSAPAPVTRMFGWLVLAMMTAFLINTYLTFWIGLPGVGSLFGVEVAARRVRCSNASEDATTCDDTACWRARFGF